MRTRRAHLRPELRPAVRATFALLDEAYSRAREMGTDLWDFAITLASLRATGISDTAIRSLISDGYLEHALERTRSNDSKRLFQKTKNLTLRRAAVLF